MEKMIAAISRENGHMELDDLVRIAKSKLWGGMKSGTESPGQ